MASRKLIDITGQRFGRLKVLRYVGSSRWECKCDCGAIVYPLGGNLRKGDIRSCGCLRKEVTGDNHRLHGEKRNKQRCTRQHLRLCQMNFEMEDILMTDTDLLIQIRRRAHTGHV